MDYNFTIPLSNHAEVARKIRNFYLGNAAIDKTTLAKLINLVGDRLFSFETEKAVRLMAKMKKSPTWFYIYSYRANNSFSDLLSKTTKNYGNARV